MNNIRRDTAGLLLCAACAFFLSANSAHAADAPGCKPLKLLNSIKMTTNADRNRFYVPVTINGTPKTLLLDTGGGLTQILHSTTKELNLQGFYSNVAMSDLYGDVSNMAVRVASFDLGNQRGENLKIQVAAMPELDGVAAGLLSTDLFLQYDIDLDFAAERLNYFSQDHCEGRVTYWPERPLAVLPIDLSNGHLNLDVTLDGKVFRALLDTGAPVTTTGLGDVVDAFNLVPGSPELPVIGEDKKNPQLKFYGHNFERLSFGDITVLNPHVGLAIPRPHSMLNGPKPLKVEMGRIIIGINVLRQLHIYIAYKEKKLYITPAGSGESALFKTAASAPP